MTRVVVPVRYPLSENSERTLRRAVEVANERDADLTVLHVNPYQSSRKVTRTDLKKEVERRVGKLDSTRYVVRRGFLVEESILEEVAAEEADVVVIGRKQVSRWRRSLRSLLGEPDIGAFLEGELNCELVVVDVD